MSLNNILNIPVEVKGFGNVYPVKLKDWHEFEQNLNPIVLGKDHISLAVEGEYPLLDKLIALTNMDETILVNLCKVFNIISQSEGFHLEVGETSYYFTNENNQIINRENYEIIRQIILQQNILFEPKIYKNPAIKKWAEKVLQARSKNAPKITLEDKLSTVSVFTGKHYWDLAEYSMYQLDYEFHRIIKIKNYENQSLMLTNPYADTSKMKMEFFAESINLYENPYDGVFKEKSTMKKLL